MRYFLYIIVVSVLVLSGCSVKKNNFFSRNYHQMTTRYNVYFNGNQALKSGIKVMENRHKEDYTNLLPVFVSNNEQTRALCASDMDYATEKAAKAIDKHSITAKPRRRKNKDSKSYQTFRKKKEFNKQLDKCYLLLGKAYFYKKKYAMANNTFRFIQRQYADDEKVMTEVAIWMFRSLTEMGRYEEAEKVGEQLKGAKLSRKQKELVTASRADFYIRQGLYAQAIPEVEKLINLCKNWKHKPRYHFILSQLYLKENQDAAARLALKKVTRFNFNYEMVFNAKINMALAYEQGSGMVEKKLQKMLQDARNEDYQDRIYYALANIEEKKGNEKEAVSLYWKSVQASVNNDNQQALSYGKLGDYYFKERDYLQAQACYDSCLYFIDSRYEDYELLKNRLTDLTDLVGSIRTIQLQDSLLRIADLPEAERNSLIDDKIQQIKDEEERAREQARREQAERHFFDRNQMLSRGDAFSQNSGNGNDWYFYNPVTIALGKNDFKRKWGRRKLEDNWRRQNKSMVEFNSLNEDLAAEGEQKKENLDAKSREYYLKDIPLTQEAREVAVKKIEDAYYQAGELYMYKFDDPVKAMECFDAYIRRSPANNNLPMVYYLANKAAQKAGKFVEAEQYKRQLLTRFPESDFALGIQDPDHFQKVEDVTKVVERLYEQAYHYYQQVFYGEAIGICDNILKNYPDNKLKANVLFLKAMCVVNTRPAEEGKAALNLVLEASPNREIHSVVNQVLASLASGERPVRYTSLEMAEARSLQAHRNWRFDEEVQSGRSRKEETTYKFEKEQAHSVIVLLPPEFNVISEARFKARMTFINASEEAERGKMEMKKEEFWHRQNGLKIGEFRDASEALKYLNRIATDRHLLRIIGNEVYRMFAIDEKNLKVLKRLRKTDDYLDFFTENYFEDRREGEILAGKWGTVAHVFRYEARISHDFVLAVPFREVNIQQVAELLRRIEPGFTLVKEDYNNQFELIVVKKIGTKEPALNYMNAVLKDKAVFDYLAGTNYETFIITETNMKALTENEYMEEYLKFFNDNYLKNAGAVGIEEGDFVYNKSVAHKFVLIYPNTIDPYKLKTVFEDFNFAGLVLNNLKFDEENDCMVISGFNSKEEGMRYFNAVVSNRKLLKPLRNIDYTNFIITEVNLNALLEKKGMESYLEFFKKYYLNL